MRTDDQRTIQSCLAAGIVTNLHFAKSLCTDLGCDYYVFIHTFSSEITHTSPHSISTTPRSRPLRKQAGEGGECTLTQINSISIILYQMNAESNMYNPWKSVEISTEDSNPPLTPQFITIIPFGTPSYVWPKLWK